MPRDRILFHRLYLPRCALGVFAGGISLGVFAGKCKTRKLTPANSRGIVSPHFS
jgi:hypothetical protein